MRYDEYLANGWPIGLGIIEGRIQHVVKGRLDLSGMRWRDAVKSPTARSSQISRSAPMPPNPEF